MKVKALLIAAAILLVAGAGYGVTWLIELREATAPASPTEFVQAAWVVYHFAPGHRTHVDKLSLDCSACHAAAQGGSFDRPQATACTTCHEAQSHIDHALAAPSAGGPQAAPAAEDAVASCMSCHGFGPDPDQKSTNCLSCHDKPHGTTPAVEVHAEQACTSCHDVHENETAPLACSQCHTLSLRHGAADPDAPASCLSCHDAHARADVALGRCRDCHQAAADGKADAHAAAAAVPVPETADAHGHSCTGCHRPHAFDRSEPAPCTSCHTEQHTLAGAGHRECTACHAPHAVRDVASENTCTKCHSVSLGHAGSEDGTARACISCHAPHGAAAQAGASASCAGCHDDIGRSGHEAHAGHLTCTRCHQPHRFALPHGQREACANCHKSEHAAASASEGHQACESCHANLPHGDSSSPVACKSCHENQGNSAHAGHATCTGCHEPHSGEPRSAGCARCHQREAAADLHRDTKQACTSCHDPHVATASLEIQSCTSCHDVRALPGLHTTAEHHAKCSSCHSLHTPTSAASRASCLSCHREQTAHEPEAQRCDGCHTFIGPPSPRRAP